MLEERTLRPISAKRTDLYRDRLTLIAALTKVNAEKADHNAELYHWQSGGNSLEMAKNNMKSALQHLESAITWLSPLEDDDSSGA